MKIKKKNLGSRNKTKNQLLKSNDNNNNDGSLIEEKEKGHKK